VAGTRRSELTDVHFRSERWPIPNVSVSVSVSNDYEDACRASESEDLKGKRGEPGGNRTHNPQIKSLLLCQLSYRP
jgi:hypothetical protein